MTGRELAASILSLPEDQQELEVFSTCDWSHVSGVEYSEGFEHYTDGPVLEIS